MTTKPATFDVDFPSDDDQAFIDRLQAQMRTLDLGGFEVMGHASGHVYTGEELNDLLRGLVVFGLSINREGFTVRTTGEVTP